MVNSHQYVLKGNNTNLPRAATHLGLLKILFCVKSRQHPVTQKTSSSSSGGITVVAQTFLLLATTLAIIEGRELFSIDYFAGRR